MALATLAQLKTQLGISASESQYDTKLNLYLNAGSDWVESYCDRKFTEATYTELLHGNRTNCITPRQWPITEVTELRISSDRAWTDAATLIDAANYGIASDQVTITYYNGFLPRGYDNVRLIYKAGYPTMPYDLVLANLWASEWFYRHNQRGDSGRTSTGKQGESVGILADMPPMIKTILASYRRMDLSSSSLAVGHGGL